ncbi:MAG TPA: hypothetical protein VLV49_07865 [Terriglobales bacterium]|nr:hypothetical protein [Terriglobales bacterium]
MRRKRIWRFLLFLPLGLALFAGFVAVVRYLWNWLMPAVFGLHLITYWQALGLLVLCWILFGGRRGFAGPRMRWRHRMRERWEEMTPEERAKFREGMRWRCGVADDPAAKPSP